MSLYFKRQQLQARGSYTHPFVDIVHALAVTIIVVAAVWVFTWFMPMALDRF